MWLITEEEYQQLCQEENNSIRIKKRKSKKSYQFILVQEKERYEITLKGFYKEERVAQVEESIQKYMERPSLEAKDILKYLYEDFQKKAYHPILIRKKSPKDTEKFIERELILQ